MTSDPIRDRLANALFFWLPPLSRRGLLRRLGFMLMVAILIAMFQWSATHKGASFAHALVYSYAISLSIWTLCDPVRIMLRRPLGLEPPGYWALSIRVWLYMMGCVLIGYALGTTIGDQYSGNSTLELLATSPSRFVGFLLGSFAISGAILRSFYVRERALTLERQATESRLRLLESQLEPHMLFNTLSNLRALIAVDQGKAIDMVDRINAYLRATLTASRTDVARQTHTLALEMQRLDDYLAILSIRMGSRLRYTLDLPADLAGCSIPPLLLQPLVENAIRHGLEPSVQGGEITVRVKRRSPTHLDIDVIDTGVGSAHQPDWNAPPPVTDISPSTSTRFGLAQVVERLRTSYGASASFDWNSSPGEGTHIHISLPCTPAGTA